MSVAVGTRSRPRRTLVVAGAVGVALAVNLALYGIGRAAGGTFRYGHDGSGTTVDAVAVTLMTVFPLLTGLALVALVGRRWSRSLPAARIAVVVLALGTVASVTLPAGFDTTSTVFLACMHTALIPISWIALRRL